MTYGFPDPLAATRREHRLERLARQRERMSPEEIGRRMRKAAHEALDRTGEIREQDFIRANVPAEAIKTRARAIIREVVDERANGGIMA